MLFFWILLALVALRVVLVLGFAAALVPPVRDCPACFATETLTVRRPWLRLFGRRYEWRWCPTCGWQALARRVPETRSARRAQRRTGLEM